MITSSKTSDPNVSFFSHNLLILVNMELHFANLAQNLFFCETPYFLFGLKYAFAMQKDD
jgi:hypothetical protein